ncbi:MAG: hypothetical protein ACK5OU_08435 [Dolichospermum sp.]
MQQRLRYRTPNIPKQRFLRSASLSHPNIPKQRSHTTTLILTDCTPTSPNSDRSQPPNFKRSQFQLIPRVR